MEREKILKGLKIRRLVTREIMSKLVLHGREAEGGPVYIETGNLST